MGIHISFGNGPRRTRHDRYHYKSHHRHHRRHSVPLTAKNGSIISIIFLLVGIAFLFFFFSQKNQTQGYVSTSGRVYDYVESWDNDSYRYLYAVVAEYVVDGKIYTIRSNSYSSHPKAIGSSIEIRYNPDNPYESVIDSNDNGNIILLIVGGVMVIASICIFVKAVRMKSANDTKKLENKEDI